jgi:hypothetical protein
MKRMKRGKREVGEIIARNQHFENITVCKYWLD